MPSKTVLFIHGLFVNAQSWSRWVSHFSARGYTCVAVPFPRRDQTVEALRQAHPDPLLAQITLTQVIEHYVRAVNDLTEPPVIIGHSFGGLITQLLLNRGLGAAGVALHSAAPMGVLSTSLAFYRANLPILNALRYPSSQPYLMPFETFQYAFVNGMSLDVQRRAYDEAVVPESLRLARGALSSRAAVDFKKAHAPLLFIAGENDHIIPASLNRSNFKRYQASLSPVAYQEFSGRNHYALAADGWEELANYALNWLEGQAAVQ